MLQTVADYTAPTTTGIVNGLTADADDVRGLVESTDGVNARLADITDNVKQEVTGAITLTQNEDVQVFCNASGGAFTITLPALSGQTKPIYIKVTDTSYNGITIACAGADVMEDPNSPLTTPTATSIPLKSPDQDLVLVPTSGAWRIGHIALPRVSFSAYLSTASVSVLAATKLYYNVEDYDIGGYYNNATSGTGGRFTPLIEGYYTIRSYAYFGAGAASELIVQLQKNGVSVSQTSFNATGNSVVSTEKKIYLNGTTDYVETIVASISVSKTILNLASVTYMQGEFTHF